MADSLTSLRSCQDDKPEVVIGDGVADEALDAQILRGQGSDDAASRRSFLGEGPSQVRVPEGADGHGSTPTQHGVVARQWRPSSACSDRFGGARGHRFGKQSGVAEDAQGLGRPAHSTAEAVVALLDQYIAQALRRGRASADISVLEDTVRAALRAQPHGPHLAASVARRSSATAVASGFTAEPHPRSP